MVAQSDCGDYGEIENERWSPLLFRQTSFSRVPTSAPSSTVLPLSYSAVLFTRSFGNVVLFHTILIVLNSSRSFLPYNSSICTMYLRTLIFASPAAFNVTSAAPDPVDNAGDGSIST